VEAITERNGDQRLIFIDRLVPSATNPRRTFSADRDAELLESVRLHGVITPLIVRLLERAEGVAPDLFEIVAGHRRYAAARELGLGDVPVVIRELDDNQARALAIIENLQRKDLEPLDEAEGFRALLDFSGSGETPASLAKRVGKPERHVWDRLQLLNLIPEAQDYLRAGRLPVAHAERIAKLTPADQARAVDPGHGGVWRNESAFDYTDDERELDDPLFARVPVTLRELDTWIARAIRFDPVQAAAAAPLDFGSVAERVATAKAQPGRGRKVISITTLSMVPPDAKAPERTYCRTSWKRADGIEGSSTCDRAVLGVVVCGPDYGQGFEVCIDKGCDTHWKAERKAAEKQKQLFASAASSRGAGDDADHSAGGISTYQQQEAQRRREEEIWELARPRVEAVLFAACKKAKLTPPLMRAIVEDQISPDELARIEKAVGKLTVQTLAAYVTLADAMAHLWNEHSATTWLREQGIKVNIAPLVKAAKDALVAAEKARIQAPGLAKQKADQARGAVEKKSAAGKTQAPTKTPAAPVGKSGPRAQMVRAARAATKTPATKAKPRRTS